MWYVARAPIGTEHDAVSKCRKALDTQIAPWIFTPVGEFLKKYNGEWHLTQNVMFPGYIFIESSEASDKLEKLLWRIPDVVTPVTIGGGFYPITDDEETFLQEMMDKDSVVRMSTGYIVDDRLVIKWGPLQNKTKQIRKIDRHKRWAYVDVSLWQECRSVRVGMEVVARLTAEEYEGMGKAHMRAPDAEAGLLRGLICHEKAGK